MERSYERRLDRTTRRDVRAWWPVRTQKRARAFKAQQQQCRRGRHPALAAAGRRAARRTGLTARCAALAASRGRVDAARDTGNAMRGPPGWRGCLQQLDPAPDPGDVPVGERVEELLAIVKAAEQILCLLQFSNDVPCVPDTRRGGDLGLRKESFSIAMRARWARFGESTPRVAWTMASRAPSARSAIVRSARGDDPSRSNRRQRIWRYRSSRAGRIASS